MVRRTTRRAAGTTAVVLALALTAPAALASDTLPWTGDSAKGENQPYQHGYTALDILRWDPAADSYAAMMRSRVPLQERNAPDAATQRDPSLSAETQLLNLTGDYGNAFFESHPYTDEFSQNLFSFWQYSDIYAPWHGMATEGVPEDYYDPTAEWTQRWFEFGMLNLPNSGYTNAAHKNGVLSIGSIFFSDNDRGSQTYSELLVRGEDGRFPVADKLVEVADYYGFDGYFVNQEQSRVDPADIPAYKAFIQQLRADGMYVQWYDSVDNVTGLTSYQNELTSVNSPFVRDPDLGDVSQSIFLNYWWNPAKLAASRAHAESLGLDPYETVFAGVEAGKDQFEQPYDLDDNLDADGVAMNSIGVLGADFVHADYENKTDDASQWEAFDRERRWWTGSSTGADTPDPGSWKGISTYVAERSVIDGTVFSTSFNTGHGLGWWTDGEPSSDAEWGNITVQDVPVTWQWWTESASGTTLDVDYDYGPGYTSADRFGYTPVGGYEGGSSLVLSGTLDAANTLRLFQTSLDVVDGTSVAVTAAKPTSDDSALSLGVVFADDPATVVEMPLVGSGAATSGWQTWDLDLGAHAGRTVSTIGLVAAPGATPVEGYQVNVGEISVTDGQDRTPAVPTGFAVDELFAGSDEAYLSWDLGSYDDVAAYEVSVDGRYLGGIYDEVLYVKELGQQAGTLELRAVAHDGTRSAPATVPFDLSTAPSSLTVASAGTAQDGDSPAVLADGSGTVTVGWDAGQPGDTTVRLRSQFSADPVEQELVVRAGTTSAIFEGVPTDGSRFVVTAQTGAGTEVAVRSAFVDTEIEPYPVSAVTVSDDQIVLTRPELKDWHTLAVLEDGVAKTFATTYSQGERDTMIRGRTMLTALTQPLTSTESEITAVLTDYAGNETTTVLRAAAVGPEVPGPDPEPVPTPGPGEPTPGDPVPVEPGPETPGDPGTSPGTDAVAPPTQSAGGGRDGLAATGTAVTTAVLLTVVLVAAGAGAVGFRRRAAGR